MLLLYIYRLIVTENTIYARTVVNPRAADNYYSFSVCLIMTATWQPEATTRGEVKLRERGRGGGEGGR
jgi:hypothetical protein